MWEGNTGFQLEGAIAKVGTDTYLWVARNEGMDPDSSPNINHHNDSHFLSIPSFPADQKQPLYTPVSDAWIGGWVEGSMG